MDHPRAIAKHAARTMLTASILPMALFYAVMATSGLRAAIIATVGWYYLGLVLRLVRRRPVIGAAALGAGLMTVRALVTFWTGSAFLFFLQPVAGTVATATMIAVTALAGRPLLERLFHDFVPVPPALSERLRAGRYFRYASLLWSGAYLLNAFGTVWLLSNASLGGFLLLKTLLSPLLTGATVGASYLLFRRVMASEGVHVRWRPAGAAASKGLQSA
jgi:Protein of unknown function (DUF3159)